MKTAILILAHKNIGQLELLISSLTPDFDIYIHVDKKWDIPIDKLNEKHKGVCFFSQYDVGWGSSDIMLATISLLRKAHEKSYNYYIFVSAQDLPLKSNRKIIMELEALEGASLIKYEKLPRKAWGLDGGFGRMYYYWENDARSTAGKYLMKIIRRIQKITGLKRTLFPMDSYYGHSMWFTLSKDATKYVLDFIDTNPGYIRRMKYTTLIDEIWLGTIVLNSPHKVINREVTLVDWSRGPEYPRIFRNDDFEFLKKETDYMFARKFDWNIDKDIITKILNNRQ